MKNKTHTHKALEGVLTDIEEIRKDVTSGERVFADMQLDHLTRTVRSIQREQLPLDLEDARSSSDDDQLQESISNARTTIGTFFDDLRSITNETYGSVKDQLQAGEGNTTP
tara:strand:+ start:5007 stop:5339 length:333 start_codon:yes stop_codon:yes gene_type:complete